MKLSRLSITVTLAAGCGSSNHHQPDSHPDSPPPIDAAPDSPPKNVVTVTNSFDEMPIFIAYRNGDGPWQSIDVSTMPWELQVDDVYTLAAVCGDATNGFDVAYQGQTVSGDGATVELPCFGFGSTGTTVDVTGTMAQPGTVQMGFISDTSTMTNWPFTLPVATGMHDLVANSDTRVLIRRDLNITAAMTLPKVDVVADGSAFISVPVTVSATDADEHVFTRVTWFTANDFALFQGIPGTTAKVVPDALLAPTDIYRLHAEASGPTTFRSTSERYKSGASTNFTLPPRLTNVTVTPDHATWTGTLPDGTSEFYTESSTATSFVDAHISGTPSWLGTQTTYAIDYNIPGFRPEWKVDFTAVDFSDLDISTVAGMQSQFNEATFVPPSLVGSAAATSAARVARSCRGHRRCLDRSAGR
jgi:hypothetical protein